MDNYRLASKVVDDRRFNFTEKKELIQLLYNKQYRESIPENQLVIEINDLCNRYNNQYFTWRRRIREKEKNNCN